MREPTDGPLHLNSYNALRELQTPCYLYDPKRLTQDYADLKRALGTALIVSVKANPNLDLLGACMHAFGDGIEFASHGELDLLGHHAVPKFINTPGMSRDFLVAALDAQATLVLDNLEQVAMAIAEAGRRSALPMMLRLNPGELVPELNKKGLGDRFGMSIADLIEAGLRLRSAGLPVGGIHVFIGSFLFAQHALRIAERIGGVLGEIERSLGQRLEFVNLGGGVPPNWRILNLNFREYRDALAPLRDGRVLAHEAGRAIFAGCGAFVTRVISTKRLSGNHVVACDGGIVHSFALAQTELMLRLLRIPMPVYADEGPRSPVSEPIILVGNSCNNADRIGRLEPGALLPEPGDYCVFDAMGAYFATYTLRGFLCIPPAHVYVRPWLLESREGGPD